MLESGAKFYNPMRVFPNDDGSELVFTLYRQAGISDQKFAKDAGVGREGLQALENFTREINFEPARKAFRNRQSSEITR
jgi:hypothetical protein